MCRALQVLRPEGADVGLVVWAEVSPPPADNGTGRFEAVFQDGAFRFRTVRFVARHGTGHRLHFSLRLPAARAGAARVWPAVSQAVTARPCAPSEFYVPGGTACEPCPPGALCDGGARDGLRTQANYWRRDRHTVQFLKCPAWLGLGKCLAGATVGTCAPGHEGLLCAVCTRPGRAGRQCELCESSDPVLTLLGAVGVELLIVSWTLVRALMMDARSNRWLTVPVWKRTIGHFQTLLIIRPVFTEMLLVREVSCHVSPPRPRPGPQGDVSVRFGNRPLLIGAM